MSIRQACTFYDISKATLQNWLKNSNIKLTRNKPPSKILNEALLKDVEQYPDDYMYERAQRFGCSKSGIEAALKRLGISQKNLANPKAYPLKRAQYLSKLKGYIAQSYAIVYMDEGDFEADTIRHDYAPIGTPCINRYNWQSIKSTNIIGAFYEKMLFALGYFEQHVNSHIFYDWYKNTLVLCLKTKCVIVMDNASFHKRAQRLATSDCGCGCTNTFVSTCDFSCTWCFSFSLYT